MRSPVPAVFFVATMLLCAAPAGCYSVVGQGLQSGRMGLVGSRLLRLYSSPPGLDDDSFGEGEPLCEAL